MIGVQDQDAVHGAFQHRIDLILLTRRREHHVQEVARVGEIVARINKRLSDGIFVTHCRYGWHLGQQTEGGDLTVARIIDIQRVVIEGRQRAGHAAQHRHRVRVATEAMEQTGDLLVDHSVTRDGGFELVKLGLSWLLTLQQDVAHFQVV